MIDQFEELPHQSKEDEEAHGFQQPFRKLLRDSQATVPTHSITPRTHHDGHHLEPKMATKDIKLVVYGALPHFCKSVSARKC